MKKSDLLMRRSEIARECGIDGHTANNLVKKTWKIKPVAAAPYGRGVSTLYLRDQLRPYMEAYKAERAQRNEPAQTAAVMAVVTQSGVDIDKNTPVAQYTLREIGEMVAQHGILLRRFAQEFGIKDTN